ncbi:hypothetical protein OCL06_14140 [Alteromonas sp. ASW11-19]|uniref:Uncharacterized protein n=1 Tax=Alteromonas salexigens TaxID=2982530 RepID=A0ABT2VS43_9ALTE|nr:hypothetical protein [Alteromonas salexigens]MCU7555728.1 hypothetical protein [Alteromonas salexigens]
MTLLVPICLLLAITTVALTGYTSVLSMAVSASQRQYTHTQLNDTAWQQLKIFQHALRATTNWQQNLPPLQRSLIQQHQPLNIRGAYLELFALEANYANNNGQWRSATRMRTALLCFPALMALPPTALISTTVLPAGLQVTTLNPSTAAADLWLKVPPHPAATLTRCQADGRPPCIPAIASPLSFPVSLLHYLFGINRTEMVPTRFNLSAPVTDCRTLPVIHNHPVMITGDCQLSAGQQLGTAQQPVLLVIKDGHFSMASGAQVFGLVVLVPERSALPRDITMAASAQVTGAMVNMQPLTTLSVLRIHYDTTTLEALQRQPGLQQVAFIPGSWHDF